MPSGFLVALSFLWVFLAMSSVATAEAVLGPALCLLLQGGFPLTCYLCEANQASKEGVLLLTELKRCYPYCLHGLPSGSQGCPSVLW